MVRPGEVEFAAGPGGDLLDEDPGRIDKARLQRDRGYLLAVACQQFQQVDTYHRGLITAAAFSRALEAIGLRYGQQEVEDVLQYCTITDDGYVHYKELLRVVGPITPRAKQTNLKGTIFPQAEELQPQRPSTPAGPMRSPPSSSSLATWDGRADEVRRIYSRWERGVLSSGAFKAELKDLGIQPTDELDHLLVVYGPSRAMPFRKLMYALQIEENDGRRARNAHGIYPEALAPPTAADFARDAPAAREAPGAWRQGPPRQAWGNGSPEQPNGGSLRQAICDFVDGQIPAVSFRQQLRRCGVSMTPMLDRLIRTHECDNSVRFQDLARLLLLQDKREQMSEGSARGETEASLASGAQTPSSSANGYGQQGGAGPPGDLAYPPPGGRAPSDFRHGAPDPRDGGQSAHRGQRGADVRSALPHNQVGRSRSAASGAHGHRHLDDSRSAASYQASEVGDAGAYDDSYYTQPPFATSWDLSAPRPRQAPRSASTSRACGHSGDIIGWKDRPEQEPPPPPPRGVGTAAEALLRWPVPEGRGQEQELPASRYGKRYYGAPQSAADAAPFGRASDVDPPCQRRAPAAAPFGTDQDLRLQRPEDAGTDEYRCASRMSRRAY